MNDRLVMDNYLLVLKATTEVYVHGTLESSNTDVRSLLKACLDETLSHQSYTYDLMTEYGWYPVYNVEPSVIDDTINNIKEN